MSLDNTNPSTTQTNDQVENKNKGAGADASAALHGALGTVQEQLAQAQAAKGKNDGTGGKYVPPVSIDAATPTAKVPQAPGDAVTRNAAAQAPVGDAAVSRAQAKTEKLAGGATRTEVNGSTVTSDKWGRVTQIEDPQHQTTSFKYADKTSANQPDTLLSYTDAKGNTLSRTDGSTNHWTSSDGKYFDGSITANRNGTTFSDSDSGTQTSIGADGSRRTVYGDKLEVDQDASGKPTKIVDTNGKTIDAKNISTDNGNVSFSRDNGAVVQVGADGSRTTTNSDGSVVQTNDAQKVTSLTTANGNNYQFNYDQSGNISAFKNEQGWWQTSDGGKTWTNQTENPTTHQVSDTSLQANVSVDGQGNFTVASPKQPSDAQAASKTIHADGSQTQVNADNSSLTVKPDGSSIAQSANGDMTVTNANHQAYQFQFQHDASGNIETDANGNRKLSQVTNANGTWQVQADGKTWNNVDPNASAENKTWSGSMSVNAAGDYSYTPSDTNVKTTLKTDGSSVVQNPDSSQVATDKNGQITRSVDASGHVTNFGYDSKGALNKISTDAGSWSTSDGTNWTNGSTVWSGAIAVNNSTGDISYKDSNKTQTENLNGTGSVTNIDGSHLSLNQQGKIGTVQDGANHTFTYGYQNEASGQQVLTSAQTPDGTYTSKDGGKTFTGPDGKPASVSLDSSGNLTVADSGSGRSTLYQTDGSKVTSDSSNRVTNVVDAAGRQSTFQYAPNSNNVTQATINDTVSGKTTTFTSTDGGATLTDGKHTVNSMQVDRQGNLSYTDSAGALRNNYSDGSSFGIKADGASYNTNAKGELTDAITANGFNVSLKRSSDGTITDAYTSLGHFQQTSKDTWTNTDKPSEVVHGSLSVSNDGTLSFARTDANTVSMKGDLTTTERPDHSTFTQNASGEIVAASTQTMSAQAKNFTYQYSQDASGKSQLSGYTEGNTTWTKSGTDTWTSNTGERFHGSVSLDKNELPQIKNSDTKTTTTYGVSGGVREVDASGRLVSHEAANGNKESFGYDSSGALNSVKSASGEWSRGTNGSWSNGSETFNGSVSVDNRGNQSWVASDNSVRRSVASDGAEKDYYSTNGQVNAVVGRNASGQVTDTLDGQGRVTNYGYTGNQLTSVSNGQNTWKASADGKSWSLNGDSNQQFHGTVAVDSHGTQTWSSSENGSVRRASADGSQDTTLGNGARIQSDPTGEKTTYTQASATGKPTQIQVTPDQTSISNPTTRTVLSQKSGSDTITLSDSKGNVLSEAHGSITVDSKGNAQVINRDTQTVANYTNDGKATISKLTDAQDSLRTGAANQDATRTGTVNGEGGHGAVTTTALEAPRGSGGTGQEGPLGSQGNTAGALKPNPETVEKGVVAKTQTEPTGAVVTARAGGEGAVTTTASHTGQQTGETSLATINAAQANRTSSSAPLHAEAPVVVHQPNLSATNASAEGLLKASTPENTLSVNNIGGGSPLASGAGGKVTPAPLGSGGPGQVHSESYSASAAAYKSGSSEGGTHLRHLDSAALDTAFGGGKIERSGADFGNAEGGGARRRADGGGSDYHPDQSGGGGRIQNADGGRADGGRVQNADGGRVDGGRVQNADGGRVDGGRVQNADAGRTDGGRIDGSTGAGKGDLTPGGVGKGDGGTGVVQRADGAVGAGKGEGAITTARNDGAGVGQGVVRADGSTGPGTIKAEAGKGEVGVVPGQPQLVAARGSEGTSETLLKGSVSVDSKVASLAEGKASAAANLEGASRTGAGVTVADAKAGTLTSGSTLAEAKAAPGAVLATGGKDALSTGAVLAANGKTFGTDLASAKLPNGLDHYPVGPGAPTVAADKTPTLVNTAQAANGQLAKLGFADGSVLLNGGKAGDTQATGLAALTGGKAVDAKGVIDARPGAIDSKAATLAQNQLDSKAGGLDSKVVTLQAQQVASLDAARGRVESTVAQGNQQAPQVLAKTEVGSTVSRMPVDTNVKVAVQDVRGTDVGRAPIKDQTGTPIQEPKTIATATTSSGGGSATGSNAVAGNVTGVAGALPGHSAPGLASTSVNLTGAAALAGHNPTLANAAGTLPNGMPTNGALPSAGNINATGQPVAVNSAPGVPHGGTNLPIVSAGATGIQGATGLPGVQGTAAGLPVSHDPNGASKGVSAQGQPVSVTGSLGVGANGAPTLNVNAGINLGNGLPNVNVSGSINLGGNNGVGVNGQLNSAPSRGVPTGTPGSPTAPGSVATAGAGNTGTINGALPPGAGQAGTTHSPGVPVTNGGATNLPGAPVTNGGTTNYPGAPVTPGGMTNLPGSPVTSGSTTNHPGTPVIGGSTTNLPGAPGTTGGVSNLPGGVSVSQTGAGQSGKPSTGQTSNSGLPANGVPGNGTVNVNLPSNGVNNGVVTVPGGQGNTNAGVINVNGGSNNVNNGVINVQGTNGNVNAGTINYNNGNNNVNNGTINYLGGGNGTSNVGSVVNNGGNGNVNSGSINNTGTTSGMPAGTNGKTGVGNLPGTLTSTPGGTTSTAGNTTNLGGKPTATGSTTGQPGLSIGANPNGGSSVQVNIPISNGVGVSFGESTGANGQTQGNVGINIGGISIGVNTGTGQVSVGGSGNSVGGIIGGIIGGLLGGSGNSGSGNGGGVLHSGPPGGYPTGGTGSTGTGTGIPTGGTGTGYGTGSGNGYGTGTGSGYGTSTGYGTGTGSTGTGSNGNGTGGYQSGNSSTNNGGAGTDGGSNNYGNGGNPVTGNSGSGSSDNNTYTGTGDGGNGTGSLGGTSTGGSDPGIPASIANDQLGSTGASGLSTGNGADGSGALGSIDSGSNPSGSGPLAGTILYNDGDPASSSAIGSGNGTGSGVGGTNQGGTMAPDGSTGAGSTVGGDSSTGMGNSSTGMGNSAAGDGSTAMDNTNAGDGSTGTGNPLTSDGSTGTGNSVTSDGSSDIGKTVAGDGSLGMGDTNASDGSTGMGNQVPTDGSTATGNQVASDGSTGMGNFNGINQAPGDGNIAYSNAGASDGSLAAAQGDGSPSLDGSGVNGLGQGVSGGVDSGSPQSQSTSDFSPDFSAGPMGLSGSDLAQFAGSGDFAPNPQGGANTSESGSTGVGSGSGLGGASAADLGNADYSGGFIPSFNDDGSPSINSNGSLSDSGTGAPVSGDFTNFGGADNYGGLGGGLSDFSGIPADRLANHGEQPSGGASAQNGGNGDLTSFNGQPTSDDGFMPGTLSSDYSPSHDHSVRSNDEPGANGSAGDNNSSLDGGIRSANNSDYNPDLTNYDGGWGNTASGIAGDLGNLVSFENGRPHQDDLGLDGGANATNPYGNDDVSGKLQNGGDGVYDYRHQDHHAGLDDGISYGESDGRHHKHHDDPWGADINNGGMTATDGREYGDYGQIGPEHKHRTDLDTGWIDSASEQAATRNESEGLVSQQAANDDSAVDSAMRQIRLEDDEARLRQDRLELQERLDRERQLKEKQDALKAEEALQAALKLQEEQKDREDEATRLLALIASAEEEERREDNKQEVYRVKAGDTLERIALTKFRDPSIAPLIYDLNKSKIEVHQSGTRVSYRLKEGSLITLPSRRQVREFKQRQLSAAAQGMDVYGQPITQSTKRYLDESAQRRANVEKVLGQIDAAPTDGRARVNVRLGDTLRSVSMKHPGISDVSLWKLLAEVNGLSTEVDAKGTPTAQLRRGTPLIIPSLEDINNYRMRGTSSGPQRPISGALPARADMTVITGNRNPQSLNIKAENLDPLEQKWVQETLINSLIEKLGESCRVVKSNEGGEGKMMRSQLEVLTGDVWVPIITYEICDTSSVRYEIAPDGSRVSIPIDLPSSTVEELMSNDLQKNWRSYAKQFLKGKTEAS